MQTSRLRTSCRPKYISVFQEIGIQSIQVTPIGLLIGVTFFFMISGIKSQTISPEPTKHFQPSNEALLSTIAFGSCNIESRPQEMWRWIAANNPDLWIWGGDIIYGDSQIPKVLADKYEIRKKHPAYNHFIKTFPVIGMWDDHDFGENDAGGSFPSKAASRNVLFDFLDIPAESPAWQREGAYQVYRIGPKDKQIAIILLDCRYFRDDKGSHPNGEYGNTINPDGDILGEAQWAWLEEQLCDSDAAMHIMVSGIQIFPSGHPFEKWADFPSAKERLFELIVNCNPNRLVFLSGDRHLAEITASKISGFGSVVEFTSSGLTHTRDAEVAGDNPDRIGHVIDEIHFGLITIDWDAKPIRMAMEIRGLENHLYQRVDIKFPE